MSRRGMTLVEMLVAMTATLLLMAAVAQAFAVFGAAITGSRGVLDLDARMRSAAWRLRSDLAGITVRPLPPITPETAQGYLEIIEGPVSDVEDAATGAALAANAFVGPTDVDDILLFTTQSTNPPFVGRAPGTGQTFESTVAEVAWFARPTPGTSNPPTYTLYRKQLLVMGYVGVTPFTPAANNQIALPLTDGSGNTIISAGSPWRDLANYPCDVSVRREGNTLVPNTLADLSRREARFLHNLSGVAAFPYFFLGGSSHQDFVAGNPTQLPAGLAGLTFDPVIDVNDDGDTDTDEAGERAPRQGEDVVLTDVIAFDVRVFDPAVAVRLAAGSTPLVPGDPLFSSSGTDRATGAYVDLDHGGINNSLIPATVTPYFKSPGQAVGSSTTTLPRTYDTWSLTYEANGRDDDGNGVIDQAFDGEDSPVGGVTNTIIDDAAEFETRPPYPYPLRGIEVRLRCYEPESRQVRQVTIRHTFVPH
jgi:prepilin-type N-terminal cleavage/methylation domain-containing protein